MRITKEHLENKIELLNKITNSPSTPYTMINGRLKANANNYHLAGAYGGVNVHRMAATGGVYAPFGCGYVTKKELYIRLTSFIDGYELAKESI